MSALSGNEESKGDEESKGVEKAQWCPYPNWGGHRGYCRDIHGNDNLTCFCCIYRLRCIQEREEKKELTRVHCREKAEKTKQKEERLEAETKLSPEEREALEAKREEEKNKYITCDQARKLSGGVEIWKRLAKQKIWKEQAKQGILFREEFMKIYNSK
jgi:hypothetical protein